jgi:glucoamylase
MRVWGLGVVLALALSGVAHAATDWMPADKDGFATSATRTSNVWLTLEDGLAGEISWPNLSTPATRSLELTVGGVRESRARTAIAQTDPRALSYRQTITDPRDRWRLVKTWTTDPARAAVLLDVQYVSRDGRARPLGVRFDPALANGQPDTHRTVGRAWSLLAGERGEYEVAAGADAAPRLRTLAAAAGPGGMIAEQVWDQRAPSGRPGFTPGTSTLSASPLAWSHAQLVRLAWAIQAGAPVETPSIVACRYTGRLC